ncbi:MAG: hypothetical protein WC263_03750 [Candidatus Micrarchaeia archaeon]|jgi:hypothetical protein
MMLQKRAIKTADGRKAISEVASVQADGIAAAITAANSEHKMGRHRPGRKVTRKRKSKRLQLAADGKMHSVQRERPELPSITVSVGGATFTRAHAEGSGHAMERLLRHGNNLEILCSEVRGVAQGAIRDGIYLPLDSTATASNRCLSLVHGLCFGIDARKFRAMGGRRMQSGSTAFKMMLLQFFRDVDFAGKVVGAAARDYFDALGPGGIVPAWPPGVRMAAGFAEVRGTRYRRDFDACSHSAELIVRCNLEEFILGAIDAAKAAMEQGRDSTDVEKYCYPPEGVLDMRKFRMPDGLPLKDGALFRSAIFQFFSDSEMANKAIKQALGEKK